MRDYVKRVSQMLPKLSEEQIKQVLKSITSENEMLDSVLDSLSTGLMVVDTDWHILKVNKIAERYMALPSGSDDAKDARVFDILNEDEISEFLKKCARDDKTNVSEEFSTTNSNGTVRFITVSIFSWIYSGEMRGRILKFYDITEKRSQEVLLRRMENMAGLTNLAAGMAHEIKNPLGAIGIHIQLIQRAVKKKRGGDGLLPEKKFLEDHLDVVNEEIENLNKLVMDFLFAVRPINANLSLSNPSKLIENIVSFFAPEFNKSLVGFSFREEKPSPRLMIDEKLFREMLVNLVQNSFAAIKERYEACANSGGSGSEADCVGKIAVLSTVKNDKYVLQICDNGIGMTEKTQSHIFEPYYTTKANGTGLGMTMAYKIIKEFSGDIHVESELNRGTRFTIVIPVPQTDKKLIADTGGAKP